MVEVDRIRVEVDVFGVNERVSGCRHQSNEKREQNPVPKLGAAGHATKRRSLSEPGHDGIDEGYFRDGVHGLHYRAVVARRLTVMTNFFLVRHGETEWNLAGKIQGATDIPLNDTGRAQAHSTGSKMQGRKWDVIVSSPLSRAVETAEIIASYLALAEPRLIPELVERNYGAAEGLTGPEVESFYPTDTPVPGRETRGEVQDRVVASLHELAAEFTGRNIIVVCHGGVIRALLHETMGTSFFHERITNGSVHSFHHDDDGLTLVHFNDPLDALTDDLSLPDFEDQQPLERRE